MAYKSWGEPAVLCVIVGTGDERRREVPNLTGTLGQLVDAVGAFYADESVLIRISTGETYEADAIAALAKLRSREADTTPPALPIR
uniref:hypothetical protein n=1 Tax=Sphingomonas sp. NY01 TaxID=2968057 RepID=UPI00406CE1D9